MMKGNEPKPEKTGNDLADAGKTEIKPTGPNK
jgi:hypothetical protein